MPAAREFQVFVKPAGPRCNLGCRYCYYLDKASLYPGEATRMPDELLESYIAQHIKASPGEVINFSWHGGEPTILGLDYFRRIAEIQRRHKPRNRRIVNGVQTNGTLLDDEWCRFLADQGFYVGLSLDGPKEMHDLHRVTKNGEPTFTQTMRGYDLLRKHRVPTEILCVVNAHNVKFPFQAYRFFKQLGARYITFLPLVEPRPGAVNGVSDSSVPAEAWGRFLCAVFDEWADQDIGRVEVQVFEEALRTAFHREHSLCIFRPACGDIPVLEHNGDFYPCDHYVEAGRLIGNLNETPLAELLESPALRAFGEAKRLSLPRSCRECSFLEMCNGECPRNRFASSPEGELGLNYLCAGYKRFFTHCQPFISEVAEQWKKK
ncbi:MAG TPA: anaerobic sulfatase maturase [Candidatus Bathyarchaeia archaeon]